MQFRILRRCRDSVGFALLCTGVAAIAGSLIVWFGVSSTYNGIHKPRELRVRWTDGHFETDRVWIPWWASYEFHLNLPANSVGFAVAGSRTGLGCVEPFPKGVTWSVRHFGRVVDQGTRDAVPWCEDQPDGRQGRTLGVTLGDFQGWPSPGWSMRIEAPRSLSTSIRPQMPLHVWIRTQSTPHLTFSLLLAAATGILWWLGMVCIPLGLLILIIEAVASRF